MCELPCRVEGMLFLITSSSLSLNTRLFGLAGTSSSKFVRSFICYYYANLKQGFQCIVVPGLGTGWSSKEREKKIKNCAHRMFILLVNATKNVYAISKYRNFSPFLFLFFYFLPRAYSCLDIREEYFYRSMKLLLEEELIRVKFIRVKTRIINLIAL